MGSQAPDVSWPCLAHHDALTGLPNRLLLLERAEQALQHASQHGTSVSLLMLDLDGFKEINDSLGHTVGDALLEAVGARLRRALGAQDMVARFGGDEFVILLPEPGGTLDALNVVDTLQAALRQPFSVGEQRLEIGGSFGIGLSPLHGQNAAALLLAADTAMYQAKAAGRGQVRLYEEAMTQAAQGKLHLRSRMHQAWEHGEFRLHYQPQMNLETGQVVGMEALLHWPQTDGSWISPGQFIPLAETDRLIIPLGAWVLREACVQLGRWREQGQQELTVSVNVSARQWEDADFPGEVRRALQATGLPPSRLILEVTESVLFSDVPGAQRQAEHLARLGVRVALDDYGTGYSNLSRLQHLPITQLKLDRSFIQRLPGTSKDRALVGSVVALAHGLDMGVVGEGIETEAQLGALRKLGYPVGQGFLLGRPGPAEDGVG